MWRILQQINHRRPKKGEGCDIQEGSYRSPCAALMAAFGFIANASAAKKISNALIGGS